MCKMAVCRKCDEIFETSVCEDCLGFAPMIEELCEHCEEDEDDDEDTEGFYQDDPCPICKGSACNYCVT